MNTQRIKQRTNADKKHLNVKFIDRRVEITYRRTQADEKTQQSKHNQNKRNTSALETRNANEKHALLYSPLAETRLTVYRQRQVKSNTGTVVASWDPRRRATIGDFDMKKKGFDENRKYMCTNISIFQLVRDVLTNFIQVFKENCKSFEEIYPRGKFTRSSNFDKFL